jgi:hypothetical protein
MNLTTSLRISVLALGVSLVAVSIPAQGFTMPAGYGTRTNDPSGVLIPTATGRVQLAYGSHQGSNKVALVKRLSFRREALLGRTNFARSWKNVTLSVGDSDFAQLTDVFSANLLKPKMVFSGSVSWPATTGKPKSNPAPWGKFAGSKFDVSFPFTSSFLHLGTSGFVADFKFASGTMTNGGRWRDYFVAGASNTNSTVVNRIAYSGSRQCKATGRTGPSFLTAWMYSYNIPGRKKQFRYSFWGEQYPNNATFIAAVTAFGSTTGRPFLTSCQSLYLDFSKPVILLPGKASPVGFYWSPYSNAAFNASFVGAKIWSQAAFDDGGAVQLTRGAATTVAAPPKGTPEYGIRLHSRFLNGDQPGGWGNLSDRLVPIIFLHQ